MFATGSHQMLFSDKIVIVKIFGFTKFYRLLIFHYCAVLKLLPLLLRRQEEKHRREICIIQIRKVGMTVTDELEVSYHLSSKELSQKVVDLLCLLLFVTLVLAGSTIKRKKKEDRNDISLLQPACFN